MKRIFRRMAPLVCASALLWGATSSCIGNFALTNRVLAWNGHVGNKFVNELVFFAFWILPVYEVCGLADLLVINSMEFWSGNNPVGATASTEVTGSDGTRYLVTTDADGYTVTNRDDNTSVRLAFDAADNSWSLVTADGDSHKLLAFIDGDDSHVMMATADGTMTAVELSARGVLAYRAATSPLTAAR